VRTFNALGLRLCHGRATIDEPEVRRVLSGSSPTPPRRDRPSSAMDQGARARPSRARYPASVEEELPDVSDLDRVARFTAKSSPTGPWWTSTSR